MNVGKSHTFFYLKKLNLKHLISSFVHIGKINIDVPLRPMDVHNFVYRESKVIEQKLISEFKNVIFDSATPDNKSASNTQPTTTPPPPPAQQPTTTNHTLTQQQQQQHEPLKQQYYDDTASQTTTSIMNDWNNKNSNFNKNFFSVKRNTSNISLKKTTQQQQQAQSQQQLNKFYFNLKSKFDGVDIRAKLLEKPCLKAAYIMNNIEIIASINGGKSKLTCILYEHCLSFETDNLAAATATTPSTGNTTSSLSSSNNHLSHSLSHTSSLKQQQQQQQQADDNEKSTLTTFDLPGIEVNGIYNSKLNTVEPSQPRQQQQHRHHHHHHQPPASTIKQQIVDIQLNVKVSELTRELNADVIAQLVFVTKIFIKEINYILQAIYSLDNFKYKPTITTQQQQQPQKTAPPTQQQQPPVVGGENPTAKIFYDINIDIGKIVLTAITPTFTSLSICTGEKNMVYLTNNFLKNNNKYFTNEYTLKPSVEAKCNISVDLKTCFSKQDEFKATGQKPQVDKNDVDDDWYKLASFDTKIDLKNAIRILSKEHDREAIIITVENPRFYLQPGAVDNAILFWLNYKSTYESWLNKREQYAALFNNGDVVVVVDQPPSATSSRQQQQQQQNRDRPQDDNENFLALKLRVTTLGLALPLSNKLTKDFKTNADCLVITLNDTSIYACSSGCVVSKGQFSNFCLRFVENFNLASVDWMPVVTPFVINKNESIYLNTILNAWLVPSGSYEICSSTIQNLVELNQNKTSLCFVFWLVFLLILFLL
jgi:hypothetical protein